MKKYLTGFSLISTTLLLTLTATSAVAGKNIKPEKITCEDFLLLDETVQPSVIYWSFGKSGEIRV